MRKVVDFEVEDEVVVFEVVMCEVVDFDVEIEVFEVVLWVLVDFDEDDEPGHRLEGAVLA